MSESLANTLTNNAGASSFIVAESAFAVGASLTGVTVIVTLAVLSFIPSLPVL